jgi:hypothetical protein
MHQFSDLGEPRKRHGGLELRKNWSAEKHELIDTPWNEVDPAEFFDWTSSAWANAIRNRWIHEIRLVPIPGWLRKPAGNHRRCRRIRRVALHRLLRGDHPEQKYGGRINARAVEEFFVWCKTLRVPGMTPTQKNSLERSGMCDNCTYIAPEKIPWTYRSAIHIQEKLNNSLELTRRICSKPSKRKPENVFRPMWLCKAAPDSIRTQKLSTDLN